MNMSISGIYIALSVVFIAGCQSLPQCGCVLNGIPDNSEWRDRDSEVSIQFSGKTAQYWIDGFKNEPDCCWTIRHIRHEPYRCVFLCDSPQAEWFVSREGETLKVEKNSKDRLLPQSYSFTRVP